MEVHFAPLDEALDDVTDRLVVTDFAKLEDPAQLHLSFRVSHSTEFNTFNNKEQNVDYLRIDQ